LICVDTCWVFLLAHRGNTMVQNSIDPSAQNLSWHCVSSLCSKGGIATGTVVSPRAQWYRHGHRGIATGTVVSPRAQRYRHGHSGIATGTVVSPRAQWYRHGHSGIATGTVVSPWAQWYRHGHSGLPLWVAKNAASLMEQWAFWRCTWGINLKMMSWDDEEHLPGSNVQPKSSPLMLILNR
jgi:hypothetical protein